MKTQRLSSVLGAEIHGINLNTIDNSAFDEVRNLFHENMVLVFREQALSLDSLMLFSQRWGEVVVNPIFNYVESYPGVLQIDNMGKNESVTENWHYDSTFYEKPPALTVLSMDTLPAIGGDTMWSNQYAAYERLSERMKLMLDGLRGVFKGTRVARASASLDEVPSASHPLVRTHPETGRKALFVGNPEETLVHLEGMSVAESRPILQFLYEHSTTPDNIYRHRWQAGDVLMWDNRCTMHYAIHDYGNEVRRAFRTTIKGEVPQ